MHSASPPSLFCYLFLLFLTYPFLSITQDLRSIRITPGDNGKILTEYLSAIEKEYSVDIIYQHSRIEPITITSIQERDQLEDYLDWYLVGFGLRYVRATDRIGFIVEKEVESQFGRIKNNYVPVKPEDGNVKRYQIRGTVEDADFEDPVIGAQVLVKNTEIGTLTGSDGSYSLYLSDTEPHVVEIRNVGFETTSFVIGPSALAEDNLVDITLFTSTTELDELVISAQREDVNIKSPKVGVEHLGIEAIKRIPTFLGEVDVIRSIAALPGVSTVGEVSSGFNVRGGEAGQNLILQDGAVIYNPTHLFGLFSAFNSDLVKNVSLHKGAGPASYGGRVSSILDVNLRNGNLHRNIVSGGLGLVSSHVMNEGPIIEGMVSYIVGGRYSYTNWLLRAVDNDDLNQSQANFYDFTGKVFYEIDENDYLSISGYHSHDDFKLVGDSTYRWNSTNFSVSWDHAFNPRLYGTAQFTSSFYESQVESNHPIENFTYQNGIHRVGFKYDIQFSSEDRQLNSGVEVLRYKINPGEFLVSNNESNTTPLSSEFHNVYQPSAYLQSEISLSDQLAFTAGIRYSQFYRVGPGKLYEYDFSQLDGRYPRISDSTVYKANILMQFYHKLEPRFSFRYSLNEISSVKVGYNRSAQYIHQMSNTTSSTPNDFWIASGPNFKPLVADQLSVGYFLNLQDNEYIFSAEAFYKEIQNAVDYIDGADLTVNPVIETGLSQGLGRSYGVEVYLKKTHGDFNGWIAYTYSRSLRKFTSDGAGRLINVGKYYPALFDQPHNLSVLMNYSLADRTNLSVNFNYSTGRPITVPVYKYTYDPYLAVLNYSLRNEYRIPDYHRLDLSLTVQERKWKNKSYSGEWVFSLFNVYARDNTYSIFFNQYGRAKQLTVLGSIFPSISYNFTL